MLCIWKSPCASLLSCVLQPLFTYFYAFITFPHSLCLHPTPALLLLFIFISILIYFSPPLNFKLALIFIILFIFFSSFDIGLERESLEFSFLILRLITSCDLCLLYILLFFLFFSKSTTDVTIELSFLFVYLFFIFYYLTLQCM